jgi:carboxymethylenebutenolidase
MLVGVLIAWFVYLEGAMDQVPRPLPPAQRLEQSPRHQEWVELKVNGRSPRVFVVYPEVDRKVPAVLIIHENRGLTDWVRSVADQVAEIGYLAAAPDLLSGQAPGGKGTEGFPSADEAREAIYRLPADQVLKDLAVAAGHVRRLPACNGQVAVAGFCWGGAQAFRFATFYEDLAAAFVFYGTGPQSAEELRKIRCPVYGFYGGNDQRVTATVPSTADLMKSLGKVYEPVIYPGAGHGFMRTGELLDSSKENQEASNKAWERWKSLLDQL